MQEDLNHNRYVRQTTIPNFGLESQEKLSEASVLVIGAGGLGSPVLLYLVAAGVGRIGIVENDEVDLSNLQRQILYTEKDVKKSKLSEAHHRLQGMNSSTQFDLFPERFTSKNALEIAKRYDLIIDCTDNFPTRYLVNDVCEIQGKPYVYGALFRFEGQVAVFNHEDGVTYRDLFETPPSEDVAPNCETAGVLGSVAGVVGTLMATEAIKVITGAGKPLKDQLLLIDCLTMDFRKLKIQRNTNRPKVQGLIDYEAFCGIQSVEEIAWDTYQRTKETFHQVVDVRTKEEYEVRNILATHIPLDEIEDRKTEVLKTGKVLIHCQSGQRSKKAIQLLKSIGYTQLVNLKGGLNAVPIDSPEE